MSNVSNLVVAIINFLNDQLRDSRLNGDAKESLEVAIQCLETAYNVSASTHTLPHQRSLLDIYTEATSKESPCNDSLPSEASDDEKVEAERLKNEGNNLMKAEKYLDALSCYSRAIALDGRNAVYYCNRAAAYSKLSRFEEAVEDCKRAINIDSRYSKAYGRMGLAYASLDQHNMAYECYKKAVELDPTNESYANNLRVAKEKIAESRSSGMGASGVRGPGPGGFDLPGLLSNPTLMNMATQLMSDPNMQNMMAGLMSGTLNSSSPGSGAAGNGGGAQAPSGLDALLQAGQQLAAHMQAANPDLVEQLRRQMNSDTDGSGGTNPKDPGNNPH